MSEFKSRKFKAMRDDWDITAEKIYETFVNEGEEECFFDDAGDPRKLENHIEENSLMQLISEPETQALQIEEGKSYITRDGRKVGPVQKREHDKWPFDLDHFKQKDLPDDLACTLWNKHGKSVDEENLDLISEYKESEIKVGGRFTWGTNVVSYLCSRVTNDGYEIDQDSGQWVTTKEKYSGTAQPFVDKQEFGIRKLSVDAWKPFIPNPQEPPHKIKGVRSNSPIQTTTVKKIISGDYGRLHVDSDGYHSLNLSIIDGKSRCVSVDEMLEMIDVLTLIVEAREG